MSQQNIPQIVPPSLEEVPKETLIELLRDKGREMQNLYKKLEKLQEKYVQIFKDQKLLLKDREVLEKTLQYIFDEDQFQFIVKPQGQYDLAELYECQQKREEEKQKTLSVLMTAINKEKCQLEDKYKAMMDKNIKGMDSQTQQVVKQMKAQVTDLEMNNTNLAKEVIELNDIIQIKNHEVEQLKKIEDEFADLKTQIMVQDLEKQSQILINSSDMSKRIQQSNDMNERLLMKNRLEQMMEENRVLKLSIQQKEKEFEYLNQQIELQSARKQSPIVLQTKTSAISESASALFSFNDYDNPFDGDNQKQTFKTKENRQFSSIGVQTQIEDDSMIYIDLNKQNSNGDVLNSPVFKSQIHHPSLMESTRNTLKMYYSKTNNYKEANMLRSALITILKMSKVNHSKYYQEERQQLEEARIKGGVWQQAKMYVTDNVFCYKQGHPKNEGYKEPDMTPNNYRSANDFNQEMNNSNIMK